MDNKIIINQVLPEKIFTFTDKPGPSSFWVISLGDEPPKHPSVLDDSLILKGVKHPAGV
jgi:hypothetical protein